MTEMFINTDVGEPRSLFRKITKWLFRRTAKWLVISNESDLKAWSINTSIGNQMIPKYRVPENGPSVWCKINDGKTLIINVAFDGAQFIEFEPINIELPQSINIENWELWTLANSLEVLALMWGANPFYCQKGTLSKDVNIFMGLSSSSDLVSLAYLVVPIYIKKYCCKDFNGNLFITKGRIYTYA